MSTSLDDKLHLLTTDLLKRIESMLLNNKNGKTEEAFLKLVSAEIQKRK